MQRLYAPRELRSSGGFPPAGADPGATVEPIREAWRKSDPWGPVGRYVKLRIPRNWLAAEAQLRRGKPTSAFVGEPYLGPPRRDHASRFLPLPLLERMFAAVSDARMNNRGRLAASCRHAFNQRMIKERNWHVSRRMTSRRASPAQRVHIESTPQLSGGKSPVFTGLSIRDLRSAALANAVSVTRRPAIGPRRDRARANLV